ncbi:hypothetical protein DFI02_103343 [Rhizobium sp. PP-F2F-G20b]|nr:hypothetical protein DFI02_103343 [Rhizobium sp. PP-F2F-G20b]
MVIAKFPSISDGYALPFTGNRYISTFSVLEAFPGGLECKELGLWEVLH